MDHPTDFRSIGATLLFVTLVGSCVFPCVTSARAEAARVTTPDSLVEISRLRLVNRMGGLITLSEDGGGSYRTVGHVIRPNRGSIHRIKDREFTASDWAPIGTVVASAVNAIHLKVDQQSHASVLTLQPWEFLVEEKASRQASYLDQAASIHTDIRAGTSIFGGPWSPFVGNPVEKVVGSSVQELPRGYVPRIGDVLQIRILRSARPPVAIELENRFGGSVMAVYSDGSRGRIAQVLRPVTGVGRFTGTQFAEVGEVRANHPGVVCVSTSPVGQIGGFQIVPSIHASDADLNYVRAKAVWLVVGPVGAVQPDLEGRPPLFSGYVRPRLSRVQVRLKGGDWREVPTAAGLKEGALLAVTHLRLLL